MKFVVSKKLNLKIAAGEFLTPATEVKLKRAAREYQTVIAVVAYYIGEVKEVFVVCQHMDNVLETLLRATDGNSDVYFYTGAENWQYCRKLAFQMYKADNLMTVSINGKVVEDEERRAQEICFGLL